MLLEIEIIENNAKSAFREKEKAPFRKTNGRTNTKSPYGKKGTYT